MSNIPADICLLAGIELIQDEGGSIYLFIESADSPDSPDDSELNGDVYVSVAAVEGSKKTHKKKEYLRRKKKRENSKTISWGNVSLYYFEETIGYGTVPHKGFYPLGLGSEDPSLRTCSTVDENLMEKYSTLVARAQLCGLCIDDNVDGDIVPLDKSENDSKIKSSSNGKKGSSSILDSPLSRLETRQYDYKKKGQVNPLFGSIPEEERIVMLLPKSRSGSIATDDSGEHHSNNFTNKQKKNNNRRRSASENLGEHRPRSTSVDFDSKMGLADEMSVAELNKELRNIRTTRSEETGCNCKPLKIDKLSVVKMRSEISLLGVPDEELDTLTSKAEVTAKLKDLLVHCVLCEANNCLCVRLGLECRSDTCECLRHGARSGHKSCANPNGTTIFNPSQVNEYRKVILQNLIQ